MDFLKDLFDVLVVLLRFWDFSNIPNLRSVKMVPPTRKLTKHIGHPRQYAYIFVTVVYLNEINNFELFCEFKPLAQHHVNTATQQSHAVNITQTYCFY